MENRIIVIVLCLISLILVYMAHVDKPDIVVHWSASKNECEGIFINGVDFGCECLPEFKTYEKVWVK